MSFLQLCILNAPSTIAIFNVDMYMIYLHTRFHMPNSIVSLVIVIKPKAKCRLHAASILPHTLHILNVC
jgi:hypothetical protein